MTWNDITLKQWYELAKVPTLYDDELDKRLAVIGICHGYTYDEMLDFKQSEIHKMFKDLAFLDTPLKGNANTKWDGLRFTLKLDDLKAGQMIHFLDIAGQDIEDKLHTVLSIIETTYPKNFAENEAKLLNCPIPLVKGVSDFFFRRYGTLLRITQRYSH